MTEIHALFAAVVCKHLSLAVCVWGIVKLASEGKIGWGWIVVVAILIASTSYQYTKD
jgi:hypothetical protein